MFGVIAAVLGAAFVTAVVGYAIVKHPAASLHLLTDAPGTGPQKFHSTPTPRVGGIPILLGLIVAAGIIAARGESALYKMFCAAIFCAVFAFAGGLAEDVTKRVGVRFRLLLTFASAALGFVILDARISELDIPGLDSLLEFTAVSFALTLFAIGGFANAINIVDGFNGLAGVVGLIFLSALAMVAAEVGDASIMWASLIIGSALVGFVVLNFPKGLIFLGDGGAYLLGFLIAELVVMLVNRNSEVSPWFALTMLSYPIVETFFSIYRKKMLRGQSPGEPDGLHFHMLVHKRLVRRYPWNGWSNAGTSPFLWVLALITAAPAAIWWSNTMALQIIMATFVFFYLWLYWRIVHFKTPKFLVARSWRTSGRGAHDEESSAVPNVSGK